MSIIIINIDDITYCLNSETEPNQKLVTYLTLFELCKATNVKCLFTCARFRKMGVELIMNMIDYQLAKGSNFDNIRRWFLELYRG